MGTEVGYWFAGEHTLIYVPQNFPFRFAPCNHTAELPSSAYRSFQATPSLASFLSLLPPLSVAAYNAMSRHYRGGQMNPASPGRATGAAATATQVLAKSDRYSSGNKSSMLFLKDVCQHIPDMKAMPLPPNVIAEFTDNLVATAKIVATGQMKLEGYLKAMEKIKDSVR